MIRSGQFLIGMIFLIVLGFFFIGFEQSSLAQITEREIIEQNFHDTFGQEIVSAGNTVVIGAPSTDVNGQNSVGRIYIYEKDADDNLNLVDTIENHDPSQFTLFGLNIAISGDDIGDRIVVGSSGGHEDAFIYEKNAAGIWELIETLTASDGAEASNFGNCVGISGDTIIVGAHWAEVNGRIRSGKAYIYERDAGGNWNETLLVRTRNPRQDEFFGSSCAISGDYVIVGAPGWNEFRGYALIFERDESGNWTEVRRAIRRGADREMWDQFGWDVDIEGNIAVIGAPNAYKDPDDITGILGIGSVFVYERDATAIWRRSEIMVNDAFTSNYGNAVHISGNTVMIGAYGSPNENGSEGKAYTFERMARGVWDQKDIFISSKARTNFLGGSVNIFDGLYLADARSSTFHSVHVFEKNIEMYDIDPDPVARQYSIIEADKATPNSEVVFIRGKKIREYIDDRICPGFDAGIKNYRIIATVISDDDGYAFYNYRVQGGLAGQSHNYRAIDVSTCTASNIITEDIGEEPEEIPVGRPFLSGWEQVGASTYEYTIRNADPGSTIMVYRAFDLGTQDSELCPHIDLDVLVDSVEPALVADENGMATGQIVVTGFPGGFPIFWFQALDLGACKTSNVIDFGTDE